MRYMQERIRIPRSGGRWYVNSETKRNGEIESKQRWDGFAFKYELWGPAEVRARSIVQTTSGEQRKTETRTETVVVMQCEKREKCE